MGLEIRVSVEHALRRSAQRDQTKAPRVRERPSEGTQESNAAQITPRETKRFLVITSTKSCLGSRETYVSEAEIERIVRQKRQYDLFIHGRSVYARTQEGVDLIDLEERHHLLLCCLLRRNDKEVDTRDLYEKAWQQRSSPDQTETALVTDYLRSAISYLRDALRKVPGFEIPRKKWGAGYMCTGTLKFCIIVPAHDEPGLRVRVR